MIQKLIIYWPYSNVHVVEIKEVPLKLELFHHCPHMQEGVANSQAAGIGTSDRETPNAGGLQSTIDCG